MAGGVRAARRWLDSLVGAPPASQALLALCAIARAPLSDADLQGIAPDIFSAGDGCGVAAEPLSFLIAGDGSDERGYTFQHARLRDGVCALLLSPQKQAALHGKLAAYGERWLASFCEEPAPPALPSYLRLCWSAHLHAAGPRSRVSSARAQVAQVRGQVVQPWAAARLAAEGCYTGYLADLGVLWGEAAIVLAIRRALIAASIRNLRARISSSLLIALVDTGTPEGRVLATARSMRNPEQRTISLSDLLHDMLFYGWSFYCIIEPCTIILCKHGNAQSSDIVARLSNQLFGSSTKKACHAVRLRMAGLVNRQIGVGKRALGKELPHQWIVDLLQRQAHSTNDLLDLGEIADGFRLKRTGWCNLPEQQSLLLDDSLIQMGKTMSRNRNQIGQVLRKPRSEAFQE